MNSTQRPSRLVQIYIPSYNSELYLAEAIKSALEQDYPCKEIVVVDNCSTDSTPCIAASFASEGVKYIRNDVNIGSVGNHLKCIRLAHGSYLKLLSSDDVLLPGILTSQVRAMENFPSVGLVTCNAVVTDNCLVRQSSQRYLPGFWHGNAAVKRVSHKAANLIGGPTNWLLRVSSLGSLKGYETSLKWLADLDIACTVLSHHDFLNVDDYGFLYRRHAMSDSLLSCTRSLRSQEQISFIRKWHGSPLALAWAMARHIRTKIGWL